MRWTAMITSACLGLTLGSLMIAAAQTPPIPFGPPVVKPPPRAPPPPPPPPPVCGAFDGIEDLVTRHSEFEVRCLVRPVFDVKEVDATTTKLGVVVLASVIVDGLRCTSNVGQTKLMAGVSGFTILSYITAPLKLDDVERAKEFATALETSGAQLVKQRLEAPASCAEPRALSDQEGADAEEFLVDVGRKAGAT